MDWSTKRRQTRGTVEVVSIILVPQPWWGRKAPSALENPAAAMKAPTCLWPPKRSGTWGHKEIGSSGGSALQTQAPPPPTPSPPLCGVGVMISAFHREYLRRKLCRVHKKCASSYKVKWQAENLNSRLHNSISNFIAFSTIKQNKQTEQMMETILWGQKEHMEADGVCTYMRGKCPCRDLSRVTWVFFFPFPTCTV